jgi:hypothetical protein
VELANAPVSSDTVRQTFPEFRYSWNMKKQSVTTKILKLARKLLAEKGWTQGEYARDKRQDPVHSDYKGAVCYCALGALAAAGHKLKAPEHIGWPRAALREAIGVDNDAGSIPDWNDAPERTKRQVLAKFDKAIKLSTKAAKFGPK